MAIVNGLFFGMMLQLSVGPVCLAVLHRALTQRLRNALMMVMGVALVDAAYMAGAIGGLSLILQLPWVKQLLLMGGTLILGWYGLQTLRAIRSTGEASRDEQEQRAIERKSFWHGVMLTLANPLTVLFWAGVFGSFLASGSLGDSTELLLFATGCLLSTVLFLGLMAVMAAHLSRLIGPRWIKLMHAGSGIFLIGSAIFLFQKGMSV